MDSHLRIPLNEALLSDAVNAVEDASYWDRTMPAILFYYKMSVSDYWSLTVYQHRLLWDWLLLTKLVKDDGDK